MGACRSTYSILLSEIASHGYFVAAVEHRDGSAAATVVEENGQKKFIYERKLLPNEEVLKCSFFTNKIVKEAKRELYFN
jgi:platelet-activating factor acetylhydrolase